MSLAYRVDGVVKMTVQLGRCVTFLVVVFVLCLMALGSVGGMDERR